MTKTICLILLALSTEAYAKSWTFVFAEDGVWQSHTIGLDKNGWPEVLNKQILKDANAARRRPRETSRPLAEFRLRNNKGLTLWPVTATWDWSWEIKFSDWVSTELNSHWWAAHNIAVDCADVVYSARWIFARNNGLPMANHLITGAIFSHESVKPEWENLPTDPDWQKDQRFLAALDYLLSQAFTHSLWQDSYPIAVNLNSVLPGGYHLSIHEDTGHTQFIYKVGRRPDEIPLLTLNSTVPRAVRELMEWVFFEQNANANDKALLRMRWPRFDAHGVTFEEPAAMPFYSQEQFSSTFIRGGRDTFWQEVFFRLNPQANFDVIAQKSAQQIVELLKARGPVVENGYRECHASPCLPGTLRYDTWSTPTRDRRIFDNISNFDSLSALVTSWAEIERLFRTTIVTLAGWPHDADEIMSIWRQEMYSSDPNDSPEKRWGF